ncbi:MAG: PAS domain S-box protein, partial [Deltaproteobacteria bacterium]|nr:PAS domain S-box protein [Deltaproteobacteria bacterium]
ASSLHECLQKTLKTGHTYTLREEELTNRAGQSFYFEVFIEPLHNEKGVQIGAMLLLRDLSTLKKMEEELRHADRLALMGTIASGLAHEIKNPLGGIKGAAQLIAREVKNDDLQEYLDIIIKESNRVNELIRELLSFAKPQKSKMAAVHLNKLLDEMIQLEKTAHPSESIQYLRDYDPSLPKIRGDENQLKQVFLNLIKNARESIKKSGKISITTRLITDYQLKTSKHRVSRMVEVIVQDSGIGMNEESLQRLFSPFYTTKNTGTGLGLAISHRIITEHQGFIHVESSPRKGTTFKVILRAQHF